MKTILPTLWKKDLAWPYNVSTCYSLKKSCKLSEALEMSEKRELANRVSYHLGGGIRACVTPYWTYVLVEKAME